MMGGKERERGKRERERNWSSVSNGSEQIEKEWKICEWIECSIHVTKCNFIHLSSSFDISVSGIEKKNWRREIFEHIELNIKKRLLTPTRNSRKRLPEIEMKHRNFSFQQKNSLENAKMGGRRGGRERSNSIVKFYF